MAYTYGGKGGGELDLGLDYVKPDDWVAPVYDYEANTLPPPVQDLTAPTPLDPILGAGVGSSDSNHRFNYLNPSQPYYVPPGTNDWIKPGDEGYVPAPNQVSPDATLSDVNEIENQNYDSTDLISSAGEYTRQMEEWNRNQLETIPQINTWNHQSDMWNKLEAQRMSGSGMSDINNPNNAFYQTFGETYGYNPDGTYSSINTGNRVGAPGRLPTSTPMPVNGAAPTYMPPPPVFDNIYNGAVDDSGNPTATPEVVAPAPVVPGQGTYWEGYDSISDYNANSGGGGI